MKIVVLDQHDSFVWNVVQAIRAFAEPAGGEVQVVRGDETRSPRLEDLGADALVLSPGPGRPEEGHTALRWLREAPDALPILGICLGHQQLCLAAGAEILRDPEPVHGRASLVHHNGHFLFSSLESPFEAARYHSLHAARPVPRSFAETAWTTDEATGERDSIMAVAHRELPRYGVQFHPESILSPNGASVIDSFLSGLLPREAGV